jgi:NAD(P)-dependent dehydrogenase (short-subunit alcohol dehydrogenase family)
MTRLAGKRILFIGGITNIGAAAVQAIVREGARVAVADIDEVAGPASVAAYGDAARFFPVDVTREDSLTGCARTPASCARGRWTASRRTCGIRSMRSTCGRSSSV